MEVGIATGGQYGGSLKKLKLSCDPGIPLLGLYPEKTKKKKPKEQKTLKFKNIHPSVQSVIIYSSRDTEATLVSNKRWTNESVYLCTLHILSILNILSDVSQRKTDIILYHLYVNLKKMIRVNLGTVSQAWGKLGVWD